MPGHESHLASPAGFEDFEVPGSVVRDVLRSLFSRETKSWVTKVERAQGLMLASSTTASSRTMRSGRVVDFAVEDRDVDARRPSWEEETQPVEGTRDISNGYRSQVATNGRGEVQLYAGTSVVQFRKTLTFLLNMCGNQAAETRIARRAFYVAMVTVTRHKKYQADARVGWLSRSDYHIGARMRCWRTSQEAQRDVPAPLCRALHHVKGGRRCDAGSEYMTRRGAAGEEQLWRDAWGARSPNLFVRELSSLRPVHFLLFTGHGAEPRANRPT